MIDRAESTIFFRAKAHQGFSDEASPALMAELEKMHYQDSALYEEFLGLILKLTATDEELPPSELWQAKQAIMMLYANALNTPEYVDRETRNKLQDSRDRFFRFHNRKSLIQRK